jgi:hypothetical protein
MCVRACRQAALPRPLRGPLLRAIRRSLTGADGGPPLEDILSVIGPAAAARRFRAYAARETAEPAATDPAR